VCTAQQPKCHECPLAGQCAALREATRTKDGDTMSVVMKYPIKVQKPEKREEIVAVCIVQAGGSSKCMFHPPLALYFFVRV
jgi:adenine-specific DNA glycosylase